MTLDASWLAARMHELGAWLEAQAGLVPEHESFDGPPYGHATVSIDPQSESPAASLNHNRICLCGAAGGLTHDGFSELQTRFARRGVKRFFVWLSPGPGMEKVREWLGAPGFRRVPWTRYPTMLLTETPKPVTPTRFGIYAVNATTLEAARPALGEAVFEEYARTIGEPGFQHFIAYDDERPIAAAALVKFGEIGYLTWAATVESDRRRGAQSALIAHRVAAAKAAGCTHIVSQTLTMLEQSFANLEAAGFREVYEQEVYEYSPG